MLKFAQIWNTISEFSFLILVFVLIILCLFMNKLEREVEVKLTKLNSQGFKDTK